MHNMLCTVSLLALTSLSAQAANNKKIMPHGLYQSADNTIWMRCALGQTWTGITCINDAKEYSWHDAKKIAKTHVFQGLKGWRLPTISELHALTRCSSGYHEKARLPTSPTKKNVVDNLCNKGAHKPTLDQKAFPNTPKGMFWSGTADPLQNGFAWYTFFGGGYSHIYNMDTKNHVRLVKIPVKKKASKK